MKSVGNWERLGMKFKTYTMEDALEAIIDYRGKTPKKSDSGIPTLSAKSVKSNHIDYSLCYYISPDEYKRFMVRGFPEIGDVLLTTEAPMGVVARLDRDDIAVAQRLLTLRGKKNVLDNEYLLYFLQSSSGQSLLKARETGTTVTGIKQAEFRKIQINVPEISIQKKIGRFLRALDEKIEINSKINENLEQQAQAIFANMFDESNTTQATISDVSLNVTDGVHNTVHDDPEGEYLLLSCKNIKGGSLNIGTSERRISRDTFEKLRRRTKLSKGDVLISSVGTIGELLLLNNEPLNYEFQRSVAMVKPNPSVVSSAYLYESLLSNRAKLINSAHGAVQQCLFISDIAEFPIRIPQQDILSEFDTIVTPMLDIVTANENENIKLSQLRDTLLPKLMSGEIDVSDLEF